MTNNCKHDLLLGRDTLRFLLSDVFFLAHITWMDTQIHTVDTYTDRYRERRCTHRQIFALLRLTLTHSLEPCSSLLEPGLNNAPKSFSRECLVCVLGKCSRTMESVDANRDVNLRALSKRNPKLLTFSFNLLFEHTQCAVGNLGFIAPSVCFFFFFFFFKLQA